MSPRIRNILMTTTALLALAPLPGAAGPDGAVVVGGTANVQGQGTASVIVNQTTDKAVINWNTFNIGTNESALFNQPSSSSVILNRVTGGLGPSLIDGTLTANGRVMVINRDGMLFGPHSVINTAGFLATTSDIANNDFMAGRYNFGIPGRPDASIVNQGHITATSGGFAALVAPGVRNTGTISATLGTVSLAAGNMYTLDLYGDRLIQLGVNDQIAAQVKDVATGQPLSALVSNEGKLKANGGRVELTAAATRLVVDSVINNKGVIEANSVGIHNGMIVIGSATGASKGSGAPTQTVKLSGKLSAAGKKQDTKGGTIVVTGEDIQVANAKINASGHAGGGKVMIGGDWAGGHPTLGLVDNQSAQLESYSVATATTLSVDATTTISASAKDSGNGGKVVLWSDQTTTFAGTIFAKGGSLAGDGGFVETSSHGRLAFNGSVDTRAANGGAGTLLLDPYDVTISNGTTNSGSFSGGVWTPNDNGSTIKVSDLVTQLGLGNVIVTTGGQNPGGEVGNITVVSNVSWSTNNNLTLSAYHDINITAGVTISNTNNASGNLILRADNTGIGLGTVKFPFTNCDCNSPPPLGTIDFSHSTGHVSIYYNPTVPLIAGGLTKYQNPTDFTSRVVTNQSVNHQLTAYMLVNSASDLSLLSSNLGGTYALGKDFSASGFVPFGTGTTFAGLLDGNGGLGVNYTISNLTLSMGSPGPIGLFGFIDTGATVRNLNLASVNITATGNTVFVAPLAGENRGTIDNVRVLSGSVGVSNLSLAGIIAGGLVGQNKGAITNSTSAANVTVGNGGTNPNSGGTNIAGGLVGANLGSIATSSASGTISGGINSSVGGLAGQNGQSGPGTSTITSSFATGAVSGNGGVGGLVGFAGVMSSITGSHASGNVTANAVVGGSNPSGGGLVGQNLGLIETSFYNTGTVSGTGTGPLDVSSNLSVQLGGLVGTNFSGATVRDSHASTTVNGMFAVAGGLVGSNFGTITSLSVGGVFADTTVTVGGAHSSGGGLVGTNGNGGTIFNANATGTVAAADATVLSKVGGLVGQNDGSIDHSTANVTVTGGFGSAGGLVGQNDATITFSSASGNVSGTGTFNGFAAIGGLVGNNNIGGQINNSSASGNVTVGGFTAAGGLVGTNFASIDSSFATGNVSSADVNVALGGLAGQNAPGSTIMNSWATGNVDASASIPDTVSGDCSVSGNCFFSSVGGLVGQNAGTIGGTIISFSSQQLAPGCAGFTCAIGDVHVGSHGTAGGLVGNNTGTIQYAFAIGNVTGDSGRDGGGNNQFGASTHLGGLVGSNQGTLNTVAAFGNVGSAGANYLNVGGLVGDNSGSIDGGFAIGTVTAGNFSFAGGLVGVNSKDDFSCSGCNVGDGQNDLARITNSFAIGNVTAGSQSVAGGLAGGNDGVIGNSFAFGAVRGGDNSFLGGFAGVSGFGNNNSSNSKIESSTAFGSVTSTGPNSVIGGFVGGNVSTITNSISSGPVSGTSDSFLGGFAGINLGAIIDSTTSSPVNAPGANNVMGGFVGMNLGLIDPSFSTGNVSGGPNSTAGSFVGANAAFGNFPAGLVPGSSFPTGTISPDSSGTGTVNGGSGPQVGANQPTSGLPGYPSFIQGCDAGGCEALRTGTLQGPDNPPPPPPPLLPDQSSQLLTAQNFTNQNIAPTTPNDVVNTQGVTQPQQPQQPQQAQGPQSADINNPIRLNVGEGRFFYLPPPGETRLIVDEAVLQMPCDANPQAVNAAMTQVHLVVISSQCLGSSNIAVYRVRMAAGQTLARVLPLLAARRFVVAAQANYVYALTQDPAARSSENVVGDAGQYVIEKLHLADIHRIAKGTNVSIAVIDSEIDAAHPDLDGGIASRYDATGDVDQPHAHGTGMAGAIASHRRLVGIAPAARLYAIRAFSGKAASADSTTFNILKGLDWASTNGVRIVNMSFAGPRDPSLDRALKSAYDKGLILIAAAGNAGPKSPPLFPAAHPNVIAVTATDMDDKLFAGANRGRHIAISAPGVDILVPAPEGTYQVTTGTSVATAHISGIVALLIERNPALTPADIRRILTASAKKLGPNDQFGAGLVDPVKALQLGAPKTAELMVPARR